MMMPRLWVRSPSRRRHTALTSIADRTIHLIMGIVSASTVYVVSLVSAGEPSLRR
jgi:hypothetical protein